MKGSFCYMSDILYENKKVFIGMFSILFCIFVICIFSYIVEIYIPFWLVLLTSIVSLIIISLLIMYKRKLITDIELFETHGHALYEIACNCIYNGYLIDSAKLFIYQYGIEYIDTDAFSYFGFIYFKNIHTVDLIDNQLQLYFKTSAGDILCAFESDNLLDLQLIYDACLCNGVNFDDSFVSFCNSIN